MNAENVYQGYGIIKRDGSVVPFNPEKIATAIGKAYVDVYKGAEGSRMHDVVSRATEQAVIILMRDKQRNTFHIEDVQDAVELSLMRLDEHKLARGYVIFREHQAAKRLQDRPPAAVKHVVIDGVPTPVSVQSIAAMIGTLTPDLDVDVEQVAVRAEQEVYDGAEQRVLEAAIRMAARTMIERDPAYDRLAARLILSDLYREVVGSDVAPATRQETLEMMFPKLIAMGIKKEMLDERLGQFDLPRLASAMKAARDLQFDSLGLQTLYDRYFIHVEKRRIELPQSFFMRVAMGLALNEIDRDARAIEFYEVLSQFDFMSSTPTLFNAGTRRPQLASCYLTTVADDLVGIYGAITENALLQKYAGGLGNDWTPVRALGAYIKGTNGESQGVIPFLKVVNDTAVAVNQGGKRKGAVCAFLETWHLDIVEFLELRKNVGDERRRTHDMNTANWVPDLFMKRVVSDQPWTLFSPNDVPDLHDLYGTAFESRYEFYEREAQAGRLKLHRTMPAKDLWRKMLTMLFETGHPWITFKDPCNVRSPQRHVGMVHSSNLCTEITLNTNDEEIAVCNLGSVNLVSHLKDGGLDVQKVKQTVRTAMRMLDNVIDLNYYSVGKARKSNLKHRPVGMGQMGFHDALQELGIPFSSKQAVEFADATTEILCYAAYDASNRLAQERGSYSTFAGSLWSQGILPIDSVALLKEERGGQLELDMTSTVLGKEAWNELRERIKTGGMRNSNCVAIAPTATIGNIVGVSASIDPILGNLSVKSNFSGEFTMLNGRLVAHLKKAGVWDVAMAADLKHFDGSVQKIDRVPAEVKEVFRTAFEIDTSWYVEAGARRQKWIDQAQSLNLYMAGASGKKLDEVYRLAWIRGLKTTYYLRAVGATHAEKSTGRGGELNAVAATAAMPEPEGQVCTLRPGQAGFEECEACQ
jgi:ribonucleoside-diphosphate reductase alpha chain